MADTENATQQIVAPDPRLCELIELIEVVAGRGYWGQWRILIQDGRVTTIDTGRTYKREHFFADK